MSEDFSNRYFSVCALYAMKYENTLDLAIDSIKNLLMLDEEIYASLVFNVDAVKKIIAVFSKNESIVCDTIESSLKNNTIQNISIIPLSIMQLCVAEILFFDINKNLCISDYLSVAKKFGLDKNKIGFLNVIIHQIYIKSQLNS